VANSTYTGLSESFKKLIIMFSAVLAFINIGIAWVIAFDTANQLHITDKDIQLINMIAQDTKGMDIGNHLRLKTHAMNSQLSVKLITNKQSIVILTIGGGFSLIVIGFALFLIGADGAFKLGAEQNGSKMMLSSTAPGLLCFLLAAILISISVTRNSSWEFGDVSFNDYDQNTSVDRSNDGFSSKDHNEDEVEKNAVPLSNPEKNDGITTVESRVEGTKASTSMGNDTPFYIKYPIGNSKKLMIGSDANENLEFLRVLENEGLKDGNQEKN